MTWVPKIRAGFDVLSVELSAEQGFVLAFIDGETDANQLAELTDNDLSGITVLLEQLVAEGVLEEAPRDEKDLAEADASLNQSESQQQDQGSDLDQILGPVSQDFSDAAPDEWEDHTEVDAKMPDDEGFREADDFLTDATPDGDISSLDAELAVDDLTDFANEAGDELFDKTPLSADFNGLESIDNKPADSVHEPADLVADTGDDASDDEEEILAVADDDDASDDEEEILVIADDDDASSDEEEILVIAGDDDANDEEEEIPVDPDEEDASDEEEVIFAVADDDDASGDEEEILVIADDGDASEEEEEIPFVADEEEVPLVDDDESPADAENTAENSNVDDGDKIESLPLDALQEAELFPFPDIALAADILPVSALAVYGELMQQELSERKQGAALGDGENLLAYALDPDPLVAKALLSNPGCQKATALFFVQHQHNPECLHELAMHSHLMEDAEIAAALLKNPQVPETVLPALMAKLGAHELADLAANESAAVNARQAAANGFLPKYMQLLPQDREDLLLLHDGLYLPLLAGQEIDEDTVDLLCQERYDSEGMLRALIAYSGTPLRLLQVLYRQPLTMQNDDIKAALRAHINWPK